LQYRRLIANYGIILYTLGAMAQMPLATPMVYYSSLFANLTLSIMPFHALMSLAMTCLTILSSRIGEAACRHASQPLL